MPARYVLLASVVLAMTVAPWAAARATGITGAQRNPSNRTTSAFNRETQIIGNIAAGQGGVAAGTGGFTTRQSNKSDSGGGAIYGCRAKPGTNPCLEADNLALGSAFVFRSGPSASAVGQILFGPNPATLVNQPPFITNGTGVVKNLNADMVGGKHANELVNTGELLFAVVDATGKLSNTRGATTAALSSGPPSPSYTVSFGSDISKCAYTATPTSTTAGTLAVATGADQKSVVVTESGAPAGFHLQVTC